MLKTIAKLFFWAGTAGFTFSLAAVSILYHTTRASLQDPRWLYAGTLISTIGLSVGLFLFAVAFYRTPALPNPAQRSIPRKYPGVVALLATLFAAAYFSMR